jgi:hypothetical protein
MSTYRDEIQLIISQLENIYDRADWLRDHATEPEKQFWNTFRGKMREAVSPLQILDNGMTDARAQTEL